jgi:hypothetical protein
MKIYSESIITLPSARYVVERNGDVKAIAFVLNNKVQLNISRQRIQKALIQQQWQRTLGK